MARMPLMAGNWKMNLNHLEAIALVQKLAFSLSDADHDAVECVAVPPFVAPRSGQTLVAGEKRRIRSGPQDLSPFDSGAHTGDISGSMLAKLGCSYVIVGHSERRTDHAESDDVVREKLLAAGRHGLVPILCIGGGLDVRREGAHVAHCLSQLSTALLGIPESVLRTLVVAYEPV